MTDDGFSLEAEAASVEEFLRLLREREEGQTPSRGPRGATCRAIFVARLLDQRSSRYAFPLVTRYVVAAFAYGRDIVSYRRTTSNAVEVPEIVGRTEDRQQKAYEEIRAEIECGLEQVGMKVPVYEGSLRRPADSKNGV